MLGNVGSRVRGRVGWSVGELCLLLHGDVLDGRYFLSVCFHL